MAVLGLGDHGAHGRQNRPHQLAIGAIVIHHQHLEARQQQLVIDNHRRGRRQGGGRGRQGEPEGGPLALAAGHADLAAHGLDQALTDGQAQAGAAKTACGRSVDL